MADLGALLNKIDPKLGTQTLRYFAVVCVAAVLDLALSWGMHELLNVPLVMAAGLGFLIAHTLSYFGHEFWTFRHAESAYSTGRLGKFVLGGGVTLSVRLTLVWLSAPLEALPFGSLARLVFALGGSLIVGFAINRVLVFGAHKRP